MSATTLQVDVAIIGGGIAGLWTLNHLRQRGYNAVLFEQEALGSRQTIASQGMIHGGIKYALGGALNAGSEAIASMPDLWRSCLSGNGPVDLRGCQVLSEDFYLWSSGGLGSRVSSFFASKMLRGRVEKLARRDYPAPLRSSAFQGQVYRLVDLVLDVPSLLHTLADRYRDSIFRIDWDTCQLVCENRRAELRWQHCTLRPRQLLLTAGAGNEDLIRRLGATAPAMQRRPLQQVLVKHQYREPFFAHCSGSNPSPRLTISSHRTASEEPVWYLGGDLATENTDAEPQELIHKAQSELRQLMPWLDLGRSEWATIRLDRAEPRQSRLLKPDAAYLGAVEGVDNALVGWPTKLTLSPDLATSVETSLQEQGLQPGPATDLSALAGLGRPDIATPCWDEAFK
ncbi:FAD-dependent oxidoreductase [Parahaliea aestuarii]|uniref:FAD-dependent oxidoreductase n=1 Tax=Parahaliea aestuarii TaxID=1852021 RepID=A0A5C8ZVH0_9GAMM|nr:FAD-dependent oxidoreductase [Parahaliea aestuarii]TXS92446.1 FAD-dependent oxidoreductase [Parahaliea aestuarii]